MYLTRRSLGLLVGVPLLVGCGRPSPAPTAGRARVAIDNAVYSWWTHPLAVNDGAYTWVGGVARRGTLRLARVHPDSHRLQMVEISRRNYPDRPDDHNALALALEPGRPSLMVFYTGHDYDNVVRFRTVNRATLAVGPERELTFSAGTTYAQVLGTGSRLVLLTRVGHSTWRYRVSDDSGATWSRERMFMNADGSGQVYLIAKPANVDTGTYLLAFYGHPVNSRLRDVGFARVVLSSGEITRADGQVIGILDSPDGPALRAGDLHPAVTPAAGDRVRLLDIGTIDRRPAVSYAVWQGDTGPAAYQVAMYRDGMWTTRPWMLASGDPFGHASPARYVGGMVIGRGDRLYTARRDNGTGVWHVEQWHWSGDEDTFRFARELARDAERPLVRPYVPARAGPAEVIVQRLTRYQSYTAYDADTLVLRRTRTGDSPG